MTRALQTFGVRAEAAAVARQAGTRANGTPLWKLKEVAEKRGLVGEGVYVADRDVSKLQLPAIVWVQRNHYVLVEAVEKKGLGVSYFDPAAQGWRRSRVVVRVYDPALEGRNGKGEERNERMIAQEELSAPWGYGWDGYALQLRRKEAAKTLAAGSALPGEWGRYGVWLLLVVGLFGVRSGRAGTRRPSWSLVTGHWSLMAGHRLLAALRLRPPRAAQGARRRVALCALGCFLSSLYLAAGSDERRDGELRLHLLGPGRDVERDVSGREGRQLRLRRGGAADGDDVKRVWYDDVPVLRQRLASVVHHARWENLRVCLQSEWGGDGAN
ncbi:MAG: cysteine peptidase family C39 domain-containing protein [Abditibacteriales bacterium]|nr:cysteine peptidase family C39 domain-containing protein [Abditibacteriales bacterium]